MSTLKEKYLADEWDLESGMDEWANAKIELLNDQLTAEREVSDKLEKALKLAKAYIIDDVGAGIVLDDALAEVEAIRKEK